MKMKLSNKEKQSPIETLKQRNMKINKSNEEFKKELSFTGSVNDSTF